MGKERGCSLTCRSNSLLGWIRYTFIDSYFALNLQFTTFTGLFVKLYKMLWNTAKIIFRVILKIEQFHEYEKGQKHVKYGVIASD